MIFEQEDEVMPIYRGDCPNCDGSHNTQILYSDHIDATCDICGHKWTIEREPEANAVSAQVEATPAPTQDAQAEGSSVSLAQLRSPVPTHWNYRVCKRPDGLYEMRECYYTGDEIGATGDATPWPSELADEIKAALTWMLEAFEKPVYELPAELHSAADKHATTSPTTEPGESQKDIP
jgi:hypothetical protein